MSGTSSPIATGAGGTTFEHKVQTEFVCLMISGGKISINRFEDGYIIDNISFQTRYKNIQTDDMVLAFKPVHGNCSKIYAQMKFRIMLTNNELFRDVIKGFWTDFNSSEFNKITDVFAIVMGLPTNMTTYTHTINFLDRARVSLDSNDFQSRVNANNNMQNIYVLFKEAVESANGTNVTNHELWVFIKCVYVISYDYNNDTSHAQRNIIQFLETTKRRVRGLESGTDVWNKLFALVVDGNFKAGVVTSDTVFNKYPSLANWFDHNAIQINPIKMELDKYKPGMSEAISSSVGIKKEIKTLLLESMDEVYERLLNIEIDLMKEFLKKYQHPRENTNNLISEGIGELFEILTYVNCKIKNWSFKLLDQANLKLILQDKSGWLQLIYSTRKSTIPIILMDLGTKLYDQTPANNYFKYRWIIENANMDLDQENLCEICGNGQDFPFTKVITDFGKTTKIGYFENIKNDQNNYKELGNIKICCAKCIRKLREKNNINELQDMLMEVLVGD
ncbi:hypothetical protein KYJ26_07125 [Bacillus sp. MCCB 382]|uniref:ABC-three component system protein n=1 Tax=Bacillus sp. MCCB 382 TaxID=2860197 RepID=UPI001C57AB65|nr:hypothetical protein [Bacillus sp. MCCB 382]